jgi:hypothetical protein
MLPVEFIISTSRWPLFTSIVERAAGKDRLRPPLTRASAIISSNVGHVPTKAMRGRALNAASRFQIARFCFGTLGWPSGLRLQPTGNISSR